MLKEKIRVFIQKIEEIQKMSDWQKRREALNVFFTEDVAALGLDEKEYVYQDKPLPHGDRQRFFFYGEEKDGSDVIINTTTSGSKGQEDKISISYHSLG